MIVAGMVYWIIASMWGARLPSNVYSAFTDAMSQEMRIDGVSFQVVHVELPYDLPYEYDLIGKNPYNDELDDSKDDEIYPFGVVCGGGRGGTQGSYAKIQLETNGCSVAWFSEVLFSYSLNDGQGISKAYKLIQTDIDATSGGDLVWQPVSLSEAASATIEFEKEQIVVFTPLGVLIRRGRTKAFSFVKFPCADESICSESTKDVRLTQKEILESSDWAWEHAVGLFFDYVRWTPQQTDGYVCANISDLYFTPLPFVGRKILVVGNIERDQSCDHSSFKMVPPDNDRLDFLDALDRTCELRGRFSPDNTNDCCAATNVLVCGMFDMTYGNKCWGVPISGIPEGIGFYCSVAEVACKEDEVPIVEVEGAACYRSNVEEFKLEINSGSGKKEATIHYYNGRLKVLCFDGSGDVLGYRRGSIWSRKKSNSTIAFLDRLLSLLDGEAILSRTTKDGFARALPFSAIPIKRIVVEDNRERYIRVINLCKEYVLMSKDSAASGKGE